MLRCACFGTGLLIHLVPATDVMLVDAEREVLHTWPPPLNVRDVTTPWRSQISAARKRWRHRRPATPDGSRQLQPLVVPQPAQT